MARRAPDHDIDEADLEVGHPKHAAAGVTAVAVSMNRGAPADGRDAAPPQTLLRLNQTDGFDCQGCAWPDPDPDHRHTAEFCENGAKAVAEEATLRRVDRAFFAEHSLDELAGSTDYWLGQQGRLTEPMVTRRGATHYEPISWDDAFAMIADELHGLDSPDEAVFYTSGRTSNEAAFAYQLFVRAFGTNNLPDCSNMCHESTSVALAEVIGIGKGSVSLDDIHHAELIVVIGQNPGTNHPRMLTALEKAKKNGAKILAINPLKEAGLRPLPQPAERPRAQRASAPSWPTCTCRSGSTATWRCSRRSARCCVRVGLRRPGLHRASTPSGSTRGRTHMAEPRLGRRSSGPPASTARPDRGGRGDVRATPPPR